MEILNYLDYYYTVLDSTKFTDWNKNLHEVFLCVRVGETLIPVSADLITSEVEFVRSIPSGYGLAFADGAFDAKLVLNDLVSKGYIPLVKPTKIKPSGYARIRDRIFDKTSKVQSRWRRIVWSFNDRIWRKDEVKGKKWQFENYAEVDRLLFENSCEVVVWVIVGHSQFSETLKYCREEWIKKCGELLKTC